MAVPSIIPVERIERSILVLRGHRVMLDADLAAMYKVETRVLVQAVRRNIRRFPRDFMFRLTLEEARRSRSQFVILNADPANIIDDSRMGHAASMRGANVKYLPYAFTEQGVAMLSSVLRSPRAVQVNIEIMCAFVRISRMLYANADLARKLATLEGKYDAQFRVVFDAIRELMAPPARASRRIGFDPKSSSDGGSAAGRPVGGPGA